MFKKDGDVFSLADDPRYKREINHIIERIKRIVGGASCPIKLDKYINIKLNNLTKYGIHGFEVSGTYSQISKQVIEMDNDNSSLFVFVSDTLDTAHKREFELLGENKVRKKVVKEKECARTSLNDY